MRRWIVILIWLCGPLTVEQLTGVRDASGQLAAIFGYNHQGVLSVISNAVGRVASALYDKEDRPYQITDANGVTVSLAFDGANRLLTRTYPDSANSEVFGYTPNFFGATSFTNRLGDAAYFMYDQAYRLRTNYVPGILTNAFSYNAAGDLVSLVNGNGVTKSRDYDPEGRLLTNRIGSTVLQSYFYFENGWVSNRVDGLYSTKYIYDLAGNLCTNLYPTRQEVFTYDAANRLKTMLDAAGSTTFNYMTNGWLSAEDAPWASDVISFSYTNLLRSGFTLEFSGSGGAHAIVWL
jgi:YD repeat-containing protein